MRPPLLLLSLLIALCVLVILLATIAADGIGVLRDRGASFFTTGNSTFAFNAGVGAIFRLAESISARIDGRYRGVTTNHSTGGGSYCSYGYCYGYASTIYWNGEVTAGLGYTF